MFASFTCEVFDHVVELHLNFVLKADTLWRWLMFIAFVMSKVLAGPTMPVCHMTTTLLRSNPCVRWLRSGWFWRGRRWGGRRLVCEVCTCPLVECEWFDFHSCPMHPIDDDDEGAILSTEYVIIPSLCHPHTDDLKKSQRTKTWTVDVNDDKFCLRVMNVNDYVVYSYDCMAGWSVWRVCMRIFHRYVCT
jgi:hypothetical protein